MFESVKNWILQNILSNIKEHNSAEIVRNAFLKVLDEVEVFINASGTGIYTGKLTPTSTIPSGVDSGVFLITETGTYTNFGGVQLPANSLGFIFWDGNSFSISSVQLPVYDDTSLQNKITQVELTNTQFRADVDNDIAELKQDQQDFIDNFSVEVSDTINENSNDAINSIAVLKKFFDVETEYIGEYELRNSVKVDVNYSIQDNNTKYISSDGVVSIHYFTFDDDLAITQDVTLANGVTRYLKVFFCDSSYNVIANAVCFKDYGIRTRVKIPKSLSNYPIIAFNVLNSDTTFKVEKIIQIAEEYTISETIKKELIPNDLEIPTISKIESLTDEENAINSKALNDFIQGHFNEIVYETTETEIRTFPNATAYTDFPMGIINNNGVIEGNIRADRRWSGNINVEGYDKIRFENYLPKDGNGNLLLVTQYSFLNANNQVIQTNQNYDYTKDLIVPSGAKTFYHNVYAGGASGQPDILTLNYSDYSIKGIKEKSNETINEDLYNFINSGDSSVKPNSAPMVGNNASFRLKHLGVKLTASQTTRGTVYRPCVVRADLYIKNPLGKYYIYHSTDHGAGNAIMMSYADDIEGDWTYYGDVCRLSEQGGIGGDIETPWVIWEPKTKRFLMYWHTSQSSGGLSQNTYISESQDGINWFFVGKAFKFPPRFVNGDGHNGYFRVVEYNGLYIGSHAITGTNNSRFTLSYSKDGINWFTERDSAIQLSLYGLIKVGDNYYNLTQLDEEYNIVSPKIFARRISDDFKKEIGYYFEVGESLLGNVTSVTSFLDVNGEQYIFLSDNGIMSATNNSAPINGKAISMFKVEINPKAI